MTEAWQQACRLWREWRARRRALSEDLMVRIEATWLR